MHIKDPPFRFDEKSQIRKMQKRGCCVAECRTKEFLIYHAFRYSRTKDAKNVFSQYIPKVLADWAHHLNKWHFQLSFCQCASQVHDFA